MENFNQNSQEKNFMTTKEWILTLLVMMIPLVNIVFLFIYLCFFREQRIT